MYTIHSPLSVRVSTLYLSTSSLSTPSLFSLIPHFSAPLSLFTNPKNDVVGSLRKKLKNSYYSPASTTRLFCAFIFSFLPSFSAMLKKFPFWELSLSLLLCFALLSSTSLADSDSDSDRLDLDHSNSSEFNVSLSKPKEGSFAHMIDQALANEFPENDQPEGPLRSNLFLSLSL